MNNWNANRRISSKAAFLVSAAAVAAVAAPLSVAMESVNALICPPTPPDTFPPVILVRNRMNAIEMADYYFSIHPPQNPASPGGPGK
jgi:hypothetical protein